MVFSDTGTNLGILQRARKMARVDSTQWETFNVVNSCNDWLNKIFTYGKGVDSHFQLDDSNHTNLPIGTTNLVSAQSDYSFLTDGQSNRITNITRIDIKDSAGNWKQLKELDETQESQALDTVVVAGIPDGYYKIADNIIRLNKLPTGNVTAGLKFYFQRAPSYFAATDTTKEPGVAHDLHRGFVIASAYDAAFTLGLPNLQVLAVELQKEEKKLEDYFASRNTDVKGRLVPTRENNR